MNTLTFDTDRTLKTSDGFNVGFTGYIRSKSQIRNLNAIITDYTQDFIHDLSLLEILHMKESALYSNYQKHMIKIFKKMHFKVGEIKLQSIRASDTRSGSNVEVEII